MTRRTDDEQRAAYAAALRPAADPSAPWAPPPGAIRQVLIHLSPLVPGLEGCAVSDDARWRWMAWVTPAQVIRRVLIRLDRRADQVALRAAEGLDGVEVRDGAEADAGLLAIIFDVPAAALRLAWSALMPSAAVESRAVDGATVLLLQPREAA